MTAVILAEN